MEASYRQMRDYQECTNQSADVVRGDIERSKVREFSQMKKIITVDWGQIILMVIYFVRRSMFT